MAPKRFDDEEIGALRNHLLKGAFLHADDNYGMHDSFKREMKKVFPEKEWVELPIDHPIYSCYFNLPNGLPKIHEHNGKPPQGLGLFEKKRLIVFFTYESDLGDNAAWYIQGGPAIVAVDGEDATTELSGKVGLSVEAGERVDVYGEVAAMTNDEINFDEDFDLGVKLGVKIGL